MDENLTDHGQVQFLNILRKAYEKGLTETEMTTRKMIEEIKLDLKNMPIIESNQI